MKSEENVIPLPRNMMTRNVRLARYFPIMTWKLPTGLVSRSSIVPRLFSSANRPIVSIGIMKRSTTLVVPKKLRLTMPGTSTGCEPGPNCDCIIVDWMTAVRIE